MVPIKGENKFEPRPKIKRNSGGFWVPCKISDDHTFVNFIWKCLPPLFAIGKTEGRGYAYPKFCFPLAQQNRLYLPKRFYMQNLQSCFLQIDTRRRQTKLNIANWQPNFTNTIIYINISKTLRSSTIPKRFYVTQ